MQYNSLINLYKTIINKNKEVIIYSEDNSYYFHLEPIIDELIKLDVNFLYFTSDKYDQCFFQNKLKNKCFYIGKGIIRILFFALLDCRVMVMTMPDLDNYHIKKSKKNVHYIYVQHSLISNHMGYNKNAFNNYNSIFCSTPYHLNEITKIEEQNNLKLKKKIKHGYGKLDILLDKTKNKYLKNHILIAPSWHEGSIVDNGIEKIIEILLINNFTVYFRPHSETIIRKKNKLNIIANNFKQFPKFIFDNKFSNNVFDKAEYLITDWSGIAFEFAYLTLRPSIFINTPKKISNHDYAKLGIEPFEISVRDQIGYELEICEIDKILKVLKSLDSKKYKYQSNITKIREANIYNLGISGKVGAKYIQEILDKNN